jgi:2-iminobutanoate/2-iminopropanoate deaminase
MTPSAVPHPDVKRGESNMEKMRRSYPDIAPAGPTYTRAIRSGHWLFISGCTARGTPAQGKSLMEQMRVTLDRITRIVGAEGGQPRDIVRITTYVTSIADWRAHASEQHALFAEYFQGEYPTNTLVEIRALAEPGLDVEIEATALLDSPSASGTGSA